MYTVNELRDKLESDLKSEFDQIKQIAVMILDAMISFSNLGDVQVYYLSIKNFRTSFKYLQFINDESLWSGMKYILIIALEDAISID